MPASMLLGLTVASAVAVLAVRSAGVAATTFGSDLTAAAARVAAAAGDRIGIDGTGTPAAFGGPGTTALIGYGSGGQTFADARAAVEHVSARSSRAADHPA